MGSKHGENRGICTVILLFMVIIIPAVAGAFSPEDGLSRMMPYSENGGQPHPMPPPPIWRNQKIIEALTLTQEQISTLKDADFAFREKSLELKAPLDKLHLQMEKAFSAEPVDKFAVIGLAQKMADLQGKRFIQDIEYKLTIEGVLTADQLKKLKTDFPPCRSMDVEISPH
jgi:Spy/CpxP family protein refolding chaperone